MRHEYRYSVEDYHGDGYEDSSTYSTAYSHSLDDEDDLLILAQNCAEDYASNQGFSDNTSWVNGEVPLKVKIWLSETAYEEYNVWCEFVPFFSAYKVKSK